MKSHHHHKDHMAIKIDYSENLLYLIEGSHIICESPIDPKLNRQIVDAIFEIDLTKYKLSGVDDVNKFLDDNDWKEMFNHIVLNQKVEKSTLTKITDLIVQVNSNLRKYVSSMFTLMLNLGNHTIVYDATDINPSESHLDSNGGSIIVTISFTDPSKK